jgi:predicted nucleotidyltransferase
MRDLSRQQLLAELRALKPEFERKGVAHLSLFGSRARGDNRPDSDVDVLVDVQEGRKFGLEWVSVSHIIEDNLGLESNVIVLDKYTNPEFVENVERDRVPIF